MPPQFSSTNNQTPETNPILLKPPRKNGFLITLAFLLILTGIFGVWYFSNPLPEEDETNGSTMLTTNKFAGWKTYRNEEYGFEFKYPAKFKIASEKFQDNLVELDFIDQQLGQMYIKVVSKELKKNEIEDIYGFIDQSKIQEVNIGGRVAYKFHYGEISCGGTQIRIVNSSKNHFKIQFNDCDGQNLFVSDYEYNILSTFKFISNSTPLNTSTLTPTTNTGNSGIYGKVTLGPVCPLERDPPDPQCADRAYQAEILVTDTSINHKNITTFKSGQDGTFKIDLPAGQYILWNAAGYQLPAFGPQEVIVKSKAYTEINIQFDSGIR